MLEFWGRLTGLAPANGRKAPEPRGGPGIEDIRILFPVLWVGRRGEGDVTIGGLITVGTLTVPHRDAMAPPELTADAPVLDIFEPVEVSLGPAFRVELDDTRGDGALGFFDLRVMDEPLFAEARFDGHVGPFGEAYRVLIRLNLNEGTELFEQFGGGVTGLESFHAGQGPRIRIHRTVRIHHIEHGKAMTLADVEVCPVMSRGYLEHTGTELALNRRVANDQDLGPREGSPDVESNKMFVAFVFRVHGHPRVARDSLGSSGGNLQECPGLFHDFVAHLKQGALGGLHDHFFIREARLRYWAPVYHPFAAIDIASLVERDESLQDRLRVTSIQRMYLTIPVTRGAELTELV